MKANRCCVFLLLAMGVVMRGQAQEQAVKMSLEEIFRLADEYSKSQRIRTFEAEEAEKAIVSSKRAKLPQADASLSVGYLGNGRVWDRDFSDGMKAEIPHYGNNFALTASQVVYGGGALNSGVRMAELAGEAADREKVRDRGDLHFMLAGYYLEMYKLDNQIRVYERNIALTDDLIQSAKARYEQGTALENDITRYELQLENYGLAKMRLENSRHVLNYRLNKLAGLEEQTVVAVDTALLSVFPKVGPQADWQRLAADSAHSVALSHIGILCSQQQERLVRAEALPHVALVAEEHLDGPVTIEVPALDKNFNYWFVGIGVSFDIASLYKNKSRINRARIETQRHEEELALLKDELSCAVEEAYTRYLEALREAETLRKSVQLARQNYRTELTRYENDLALATDMLEVSNALLDAELRLANACADAQYSYYRLKHLSGTL